MCETLLLEAIPGSAALVDAQGRVGQMNLAWAQAAPGNPFLEGMATGADYLSHCQALAKSTDGHVALVASGIVSALQGRLKRLKLEYPLPVQGGTRWFSLQSTSGGGTVIVHLDITERMVWEKRLRRSEQLFKATTEHALDLMAILGVDGTILYASPSCGKTFGQVPGAPLRGKLQDWVLEEDRAVFQEHCQAGFRLGVSPRFEYRMVHRDGPVRYLEAQAVAVEDFSGGQASILLTSRDVSARKEAEAQKALMEIELRHAQKMEAIGQLAAGIAHEINTPCQYLNDNLGFLAEAFGSLQAVMGALGAFLDQAPAGLDLSGPRKAMVEQDVAYFLDEAPRAIGQSRDGLARISTIVKAMKIFAHPGEEGRVPVNLNEALENTLVVAQGEWKYVAEVDRDFAPDLPAIVGSAGELNEVFLHLIVNAAQAIAEKGEAGKGRITVATRALEEGVEIRIRDTGMGIPDAIRDRVFLPFFSTKPVGKGTGQGLSIVHSVIAKHGGTVAFESEPGQGACFIIHLPLGA